MRRRRRKGVFEKLKAYDAVYYTQEEFQLTALSTRFPNFPIALELGCGRGLFLTEYAKVHMDQLCIGVELKEEVLIKACEKAKDNDLENVFFVLGDGERLIDAFREEPIDQLMIHFCDPWPKDRHAKRRLVHGRFLKQYAAAMKQGGRLQFKTDNLDLFEFALKSLMESPFEVQSIAYDIAHHEDWHDNLMTEYESRFRELGQPIYGVVALRK